MTDINNTERIDTKGFTTDKPAQTSPDEKFLDTLLAVAAEFERSR